MARVGLVQFDIAWENADGNVNKLRERFKGVEPGTFDLIVLPELWACGFTMNHDAHKVYDTAIDFMKELSGQQKCPVVGGVPAKTEAGQENRCYLVDGSNLQYYSKNRAFKFAGEHHKYQQGDQLARWDLAGFIASPFVCYDLRFPELARKVMPESNLLIYVANWPSVRVHHWRQLLIARAIENLAYVVAVNRTGTDGAGLDYPGNSMVISPAGEIQLEAGSKESLLSASIDPEYVASVRAKWPFLNDM